MTLKFWRWRPFAKKPKPRTWKRDRERHVTDQRYLGMMDPRVDMLELEARGSGRTTGIALAAIGNALKNPRRKVLLVDHNPDRTYSLVGKTARLIERLGLEEMEVDVNRGEWWVRFNL